MGDRLEIDDILRNEVGRATKEFEEAKRNFWQVCSDVPSGIPHPDGALRLQKTAHAQTVAMQALAAAIHRFNAFLLNGAIPEDLEK
jgi:hypothetical protein